MQTRLVHWSIPVLSLILVLGCTPKQTPPPTDTGTPRGVGTESEPQPLDKPFSNEVFVLVSVENGAFKVLPDPVVVQNRSQQVIWIAEDPDVAMKITFRPEKGKDTPGATPPDNPCPAQARRCGGVLVGGTHGKFHYSVTGTKAGQPLPELDPVLDILP